MFVGYPETTGTTFGTKAGALSLNLLAVSGVLRYTWCITGPVIPPHYFTGGVVRLLAARVDIPRKKCSKNLRKT